MTEASWKRLLSKIQESNVVPIVGPRLLVVADGQTSLQEQIARRLLQACGAEVGDLPLPPFRELNEVVSRLKGAVDNLQDLYDYVHEAIRAMTAAGDFAMPAAIRQLADIRDFRLFVTLTPDDLLARCLRERCAVNEIVHSPNLPTSEGKDLPRDWQERTGEVFVLYLFGKSRSAPMFAIHDEDVLEYAHNVIARGSQVPSAFLGELRQRNLLLVGSNFPDWLGRFFLRATNQKRLSEKDRRAWLIEPLQPEESLTCFLRSYSKDTEILSQTSPLEFVAELHRRWMAEHGSGPPAADPGASKVGPRGTMFFISYSRTTDLPRAEALYQALLKLGVAEGEVWFDRLTIEPGQDFRRRIVDGIHGCRYFLALVSQAACARREAFALREWLEADDRRKGVNGAFVLPLIVDDAYEPEGYTTEPLRQWARQLDFGHAPRGLPDARLETTLKNLVREARRGSESS